MTDYELIELLQERAENPKGKLTKQQYTELLERMKQAVIDARTVKQHGQVFGNLELAKLLNDTKAHFYCDGRSQRMLEALIEVISHG